MTKNYVTSILNKYNTLLLLVFVFFFTNLSFSQTSVVYTTAGAKSWVCPVGVTSVQVEAWGGGAGGTFSANTNGHVGGGGGGGSYARRNSIAVTAGTTYNFTVTLGAGGATSTAGGATSTTFNTVFINAPGGSAGVASGTGTRAGGAGGVTGTGDITYAGGNGGSGIGNGASGGSGSGGGGGSAAGSTGPGSPGGNAANTTTPGAGGATVASFGGAGGNGGNNANGQSATANYGGGGGGAGHKNNTGGSGMNGALILTFTCPTNTTNAGPDQNLTACSTTATLAATPVTYGTGTWSVIAGTATITSPNSPTSGITGIIPGTPVTLRWSISNGDCGTTTDDVIISSPQGPGCFNYCAPTHTVSCTGPITNVTFNTINNTTGCANTNGVSYTNYAAGGTPTTSLLIGSSYNLTVSTSASSIVSAWIDFNANGTFETTEWTQVYTTGTTGTVSVLIPFGATPGVTTIRLRSRTSGNINGDIDSCTAFGSGETEDYAITLIAPPACLAPTAQPTALNMTASGTIISGSFTASSPAANSYLVVISTSATPPTAPVNGTTYTIGGTLAPGYTIVDTDSNTPFSITGLTNLTTYYFYIYSFNNLCTGGPLYLGTSPLTGNITTGLVDYCSATSTVSTRYVEDISTAGCITNITNMGTGRAATGYADYTAIPPVTQVPGGGVTLDYRLVNSRQYVKVWVDYNNDGTFTDAAPELVYNTGGVQTIAGSAGFVVPLATLPGNYRIRFRSYEASQTFSPCGNLATGETEDYRLVVVADCSAKITSVVDGSRCDTGTVNVTTNGSVGTIQYRFYTARTGGLLVGTSASTSWTTPSISTTTSYFVTAFNGTCESWYREEVKAIVNPTTTINVTPSAPEVCGDNNVLSISALGDVVTDYLVDENFEGGAFGVLTRVNVAADANTQWTNRASPYVPTGSVWKPAITSRTIGNRYALTVSDFAAPAPKDTQLRTANLIATPYTDLYLSFRHYFSYYVGEPLQFADLDVSTDGGTGWTNIQRYTSTQGYAGEFTDVTINVSAYAGLPQVMFRFRYHLQGSAFCDGWAIDDVKVYGTRPLNTTFTWSGGVTAFTDFACTIPYVAQSVTTVYVKPTAAQLELPTYSFTATATLGNGCPVSKLISITNKTKVWKGTTSNDWNVSSNWLPAAVPDATTCVIIPTGTTSQIMNAPNALAKTVTVKAPTGNLELQSNRNLTVTDNITVEAGAIFNVRNAANLIQVNNTTNVGNINMQRNASIKLYDYVYWSTPVASFASSAISPASTLIYKWMPTTATAYASNFGNWAYASEAMTTGRGYIVRAPGSYTTIPANFTATFTGVPNNGDITTAISRSTYVGAPYAGPTTTLVTANDDNWNLVGNPYPSAISADAFLLANNTKIPGWIRIWTHGTAPNATNANQFYQNYTYNYSSSDYLTYNYLGGTIPGFDGFIPAGQSFFVLMLDAAATPNTLSFTNSMRNSSYRNDQFFRTSETENVATTEKHRIWLDLLDTNNTHTRTLVGYAYQATNNYDTMYDAKSTSGEKSKFDLYSMIDTEEMRIQGKGLPFMQSDKIALGFTTPRNDTYTIAIANTDGLFKDKEQQILLEDTYLKKTHELSAAPYEFTSESGKFNDRFILKYYKKEATTSPALPTMNVNVYTTSTVNVKSTDYNITKVEVYDIQGKKLCNLENVNKKALEIAELRPTQGVLVVKVTLENGTVEIKKVLF